MNCLRTISMLKGWRYPRYLQPFNMLIFHKQYQIYQHSWSLSRHEITRVYVIHRQWRQTFPMFSYCMSGLLMTWNQRHQQVWHWSIRCKICHIQCVNDIGTFLASRLCVLIADKSREFSNYCGTKQCFENVPEFMILWKNKISSLFVFDNIVA